jgi:Na+-transporting NADH:ubiquinone oxidoreductase subunit NqrB
VLTDLLIAMVLTPRNRGTSPLSLPAVARLAKYIFRTRSANIFNPAALALVVVYYAFGSGQSWWGALPSDAVCDGAAVRDRHLHHRSRE